MRALPAWLSLLLFVGQWCFAVVVYQPESITGQPSLDRETFAGLALSGHEQDIFALGNPAYRRFLDQQAVFPPDSAVPSLGVAMSPWLVVGQGFGMRLFTALSFAGSAFAVAAVASALTGWPWVGPMVQLAWLALPIVPVTYPGPEGVLIGLFAMAVYLLASPMAPVGIHEELRRLAVLPRCFGAGLCAGLLGLLYPPGWGMAVAGMVRYGIVSWRRFGIFLLGALPWMAFAVGFPEMADGLWRALLAERHDPTAFLQLEVFPAHLLSAGDFARHLLETLSEICAGIGAITLSFAMASVPMAALVAWRAWSAGRKPPPLNPKVDRDPNLRESLRDGGTGIPLALGWGLTGLVTVVFGWDLGPWLGLTVLVLAVSLRRMKDLPLTAVAFTLGAAGLLAGVVIAAQQQSEGPAEALANVLRPVPVVSPWHPDSALAQDPEEGFSRLRGEYSMEVKGFTFPRPLGIVLEE